MRVHPNSANGSVGAGKLPPWSPFSACTRPRDEWPCTPAHPIEVEVFVHFLDIPSSNPSPGRNVQPVSVMRYRDAAGMSVIHFIFGGSSAL
jgi:hypothetical protein